MVLKSPRFGSNRRLQAAAENQPAMAAFEPDRGAVAILQLALRDLHDPQIGSLPRSIRNDTADGIYGQETVNAVKAFQRRHGLSVDGGVGKETLHELDAMFRAGRPWTRPTPPMEKPTRLAVRSFLAVNLRQNVHQCLLKEPSNLVVLAEHHTTALPVQKPGKTVMEIIDQRKPYFLTQLIWELSRGPSPHTYFHAAEDFHDDPQTHQEIDEYLDTPFHLRRTLQPAFKLRPHIRAWLSTLESAAQFPGRRYAILPAGSHVSGATAGGRDARHGAIFAGFNHSIQLHNAKSPAKVTSSSWGTFLIGAQHGYRRNHKGTAARTTTRLLVDAGWRVHVVRLTLTLWQRPPNPMERIELEPLVPGEGESFDLMPMLIGLNAGARY